MNELRDIVRLLEIAFSPNKYESCLVHALHRANREIVEKTVYKDDRLIAYSAFSKAYRQGAHIGWHLAPVAVAPGHQRQGLGTNIIVDGLKDPRIHGTPIFVLGPPSYYARFGFQVSPSIYCPFDPSGQHFMSLNWNSRERFQIDYEHEFKEA
jgi:putative acetyltransferase